MSRLSRVDEQPHDVPAWESQWEVTSRPGSWHWEPRIPTQGRKRVFNPTLDMGKVHAGNSHLARLRGKGSLRKNYRGTRLNYIGLCKHS